MIYGFLYLLHIYIWTIIKLKMNKALAGLTILWMPFIHISSVAIITKICKTFFPPQFEIEKEERENCSIFYRYTPPRTFAMRHFSLFSIPLHRTLLRKLSTVIEIHTKTDAYSMDASNGNSNTRDVTYGIFFRWIEFLFFRCVLPEYRFTQYTKWHSGRPLERKKRRENEN